MKRRREQISALTPPEKRADLGPGTPRPASAVEDGPGSLKLVSPTAGSSAPREPPASTPVASIRDAEPDSTRLQRTPPTASRSPASTNEELTEAAYVDYAPRYLSHLGQPHPDPVVETESLGCVNPPEPHTPDVKAIVESMQDVLDAGTVSSLQLETVHYAHRLWDGQYTSRLECGSRRGFFLGDGAGVGKGRQIAALATLRWRMGTPRILWVSVCPDLQYDAKRDLDDLESGDSIPLYPGRGKMPSDLASKRSGCGDGILFVTYSLLIRPQRFDQIRRWLQRGSLSSSGEDCMIVFDECHRAKHLVVADKTGKVSSQTAQKVHLLQKELPEARVLYASATGASEPMHLAYMCRLSAGGFSDIKAFARSLDQYGLSAMELFAMSLKGLGSYCCRTLSYHGAEFAVVKAPLTDHFKKQYEQAADFLVMVGRVVGHIADIINAHVEEIRQQNPESAPPRCGIINQFWASHMRFFRSLLMCARVPKLAQEAGQALEDGYSVVIGLQSTGEAGVNQALQESAEPLVELVSAPKMAVRQFLKNHIPVNVPRHMDDQEFESLFASTFQIVNAWMEGAAGDTRAPPMEATGEADDSDGGIEVVRSKSVHDIEKEKLEHATRTGALINLDEKIPPEAMAEMETALHIEVEKARCEAKSSDLGTPTEEDSVAGAGLERLPCELALAEVMQLASREIAARRQGTGAAANLVRAPSAGLEGATAEAKRTGQVDLQNCTTACVVDSDHGLADSPEAIGQAGTKYEQPPTSIIPEADAGLSVSHDLPDEEYNSDDSDCLIVDPFSAAGLRASCAASRTKAKRPQQVARSAGHDSCATVPALTPVLKRRAGPETWYDHLRDGDPEDAGGHGEPLETVYPSRLCRRLAQIRALLLRALDVLDLPPNPLDDLTERLGGPGIVAEMTGRTERLVQGDDGTFELRRRCQGTALRDINTTERHAFMMGHKTVAIISDAASTGISLHADRRYPGCRRRRMHFTLELPWSAEKAIQQFGRSHRSNQTSAPVYRLLVTDCAGEARFASAAAKRLQTLGALLKGDRRAMEAGVGLTTFDIDNEYGRKALDYMLRGICRGRSLVRNVDFPSPPQRPVYEGMSFCEVACDALSSVGVLRPLNGPPGSPRFQVTHDRLEVRKFLNRLLGLAVDLQGTIFAYFQEVFDAVVQAAKLIGTFDDGVSSCRARSLAICPGYPVQVMCDPQSSQTLDLYQIKYDLGMTWEEALGVYEESRATIREELACQGELDAAKLERDVAQSVRFMKTSGRFHVGRPAPVARVVLAIRILHGPDTHNKRFRLFRPSSAHPDPDDSSSKPKNIVNDGSLQSMTVIDELEAESLWTLWYTESADHCMHGRNPKCMCSAGKRCQRGQRIRTDYILSGSILPWWRLLSDRVLRLADPTARRRDDDPHDRSEATLLVDASTEGEECPLGSIATAAYRCRRASTSSGAPIQVWRCSCDDGKRVIGIRLHTGMRAALARIVEEAGGLPTSAGGRPIHTVFGISRNDVCEGRGALYARAGRTSQADVDVCL